MLGSREDGCDMWHRRCVWGGGWSGPLWVQLYIPDDILGNQHPKTRKQLSYIQEFGVFFLYVISSCTYNGDCTQSITHSTIHSVIHSLNQSSNQSVNQSLFTHSQTRSLDHSHSPSLTQLLTNWYTYSITPSVTHSLTHSFINQSVRLLTN